MPIYIVARNYVFSKFSRDRMSDRSRLITIYKENALPRLNALYDMHLRIRRSDERCLMNMPSITYSYSGSRTKHLRNFQLTYGRLIEPCPSMWWFCIFWGRFSARVLYYCVIGELLNRRCVSVCVCEK